MNPIDPPQIPGASTPDDKLERVRDRTSHGTDDSAFNKAKRERTSEADAKVEEKRYSHSDTRMVDERSQFRKPSEVLDVKTRRLVSNDQKPREDTRTNPSGPQGITVHGNPDISGGVQVRTEKGILVRTTRQDAQRMMDRAEEGRGMAQQPAFPVDLEARIMNILSQRMPEIMGMSWNVNGQSAPADGSVPTKVANGVKWGAGGSYDFRTSGKVYVAGADKTPTFSTAEKAAADVWIKVFFDGTACTVHTASPGASTDTYEVYRITSGGANMQYGDIHESRT